MATNNTPRYTNYTTTTSFANALSIADNRVYTAFLAINTTGENVDITFDDADDTRFFVESGGAILIDVGFKFTKNIRARAASGGAGAAGLHVTIW